MADTNTNTENANAANSDAADKAKSAEGGTSQSAETKAAGDADKGQPDAEKLAADKAAQDVEVEKRAKKLAAQMVKDELAKAKRESDEAAELAKKSDIEREQAKTKKAEEKQAAAEKLAAAATLKADLADQLIDQGLVPASSKAREHILAAFKVHVEAGKDAADALKTVKSEEGYLFKQPAAATPEKKAAAATTGAKPDGKDERAAGDVTAGKPGSTATPNPGDLKTPAEIQAAIRAKHGISLPLSN